MKNGVIVPCYNEADRLKFNEFASFLNQNSSYVLCFVNDGSKDDTLNQLLKFQNENSNLNIIVHNLESNAGKAEAVRQGALRLLEIESVKSMGFLDADLATGFDDYLRLSSALKFRNLAMVFGSRKMDNSNDIERSGFRKFASMLVGMMIKMIVGMPIKDTQCGAKIFSRSLSEKVFKKNFQSRWLFDVEIFIRVNNLFKSESKNKIAELGLHNWEEVEGSKITLKDSLKFPMQLLEIAYDYRLRPRLASVNYQIGKVTSPLMPAA